MDANESEAILTIVVMIIALDIKSEFWRFALTYITHQGSERDCYNVGKLFLILLACLFVRIKR